jgi:hypothetical protein
MIFHVESKLADGTYREDSYEVANVDVEPFTPGNLSGPPEDCYPDEGGFAQGYGDVLWKVEGKGEAQKISWEEFIQRYAAAHDPVSLEDAEESINEQLYTSAEEEAEGAYEAACESAYDEWKDEGKQGPMPRVRRRR